METNILLGKKRSIGSLTAEHLRNNQTSIRKSIEDRQIVTVLLLTLAKELDDGNSSFPSLLSKFNEDLQSARVGLAGKGNWIDCDIIVIL